MLMYTIVELRAVVPYLTVRGSQERELIAFFLMRTRLTTYQMIPMVRRWRREFLSGCTSLQDETSSGRPRDCRTAKNIERIRQLIK